MAKSAIVTYTTRELIDELISRGVNTVVSRETELVPVSLYDEKPPTHKEYRYTGRATIVITLNDLPQCLQLKGEPEEVKE